MAPGFRKNIYQIYSQDSKIEALICFSRDIGFELILAMRDKISDYVLSKQGLFLYKVETKGKIIDSWFKFFDRNVENAVKDFFSQKYPGMFACLFNSRKWREYKEEEDRINQLARFVLNTSHDFPCIVAASLINSAEELAGMIESAARELNISMSKSTNLGSISNVLMSNRTFD